MLTLILQGVALVGVSCMGLSVVSFLTSLFGFQYFLKAKRFAGFSRLFSGVTLLCVSALFAASVMLKDALPASFLEWAIATTIVSFTAITGGQLVKDGLSEVRNNPR